MAALDAGHHRHHGRPGQRARARSAGAVPGSARLGGQRHLLGAGRDPPSGRAVLLLLLRRPPGRAHRGPRRGRVELDHRTVREPGRDAALGRVRPAQRRRHELRPDHPSQHRRPRRLLRPRREALDGVRLVLRRHLHPGDGPGHRLPAPEPGLREEADRREPQPDRRGVRPLQPRVRVLLPVPFLRRPRLERRLQHPPGPLPPARRALLRRGRQRPHGGEGRTRYALRRRVHRPLRGEADGQLAVPARARRAGGHDHRLPLTGPQLRLLRSAHRPVFPGLPYALRRTGRRAPRPRAPALPQRRRLAGGGAPSLRRGAPGARPPRRRGGTVQAHQPRQGHLARHEHVGAGNPRAGRRGERPRRRPLEPRPPGRLPYRARGTSPTAASSRPSGTTTTARGSGPSRPSPIDGVAVWGSQPVVSRHPPRRVTLPARSPLYGKAVHPGLAATARRTRGMPTAIRS